MSKIMVSSSSPPPTQTPSSSQQHQQLLVGDPSGRSTSEYWNTWFTTISKGQTFEWYTSPNEIDRILLSSYLFNKEETTTKIIHPGSGNSLVPIYLRDKYQNSRQYVLDCSTVAISEMQSRHNDERMDYRIGNILESPLSYPDDNFDAWIDKGLVDALFSDCADTSKSQCHEMFQESLRILKPNGICIVVTLAQDHSLKLLLQSVELWQRSFDVYELDPLLEDKSSLRPFGFVFRKTHQESSPSRHEMVFHKRNGEIETINAMSPSFEPVYERIQQSQQEFTQHIQNEQKNERKLFMTLEIKPLDIDTDLNVLHDKISQDEYSFCSFIAWKEFEIVPIGYGLKKLVLKCIVDSNDVEALCEWIEEREDVQSVDVDWENTVTVSDAGSLCKRSIVS